MLSVVIPALDSERPLVATLATLVPGATCGLIRDVLIADGGSRDDTAAVADVAGCNFMAFDGSRGRRLKAAALAARASWLLFVLPGTLLDTPWTGEVGRFIEQPAADARAAVFRRAAPVQSAPRQIVTLLSAALGALPHPDQGLLVSKQFYAEIGGHSELAADPEADLLKRIGRQRIAMLSTTVSRAG
jgi:hypothetical protein